MRPAVNEDVMGGECSDSQTAAPAKPARPLKVGIASDALIHGRRVYVDPLLVRQATSRSLTASARARSFFRLWFSICRMRSRVTLNVRPTSSSVLGCWPSSP